MSNRIVSTRGWLTLLLTVTAFAGCGDIGKLPQNSSAGRADSADLRLDSQGISEREIFASEDPLHNQLWVLTLDEVRVYNTATTGKKLIRKIALRTGPLSAFAMSAYPTWHWIGQGQHSSPAMGKRDCCESMRTVSI
jgi:hypothetical protein